MKHWRRHDIVIFSYLVVLIFVEQVGLWFSATGWTVKRLVSRYEKSQFVLVQTGEQLGYLLNLHVGRALHGFAGLKYKVIGF